VPEDLSSIQEAITQANHGDTICVAAGTYPENLDWEGKDVWVYGTDGAQVTILDGGASDRVVRFASGETSMAGLQNVTVQNGKALKGAGVFIYESSPSLVDVIIKENHCEPSSVGGCDGVGLYVFGGSPVTRGLRIADNSITANVDSENFGVALYSSGSTLNLEGGWLTDNLFEIGDKFEFKGEGPSVYGVGIYAWDSDLTLSQVVIAKNRATGAVDATFQGSALYVTDLSHLIGEHILVADNVTQHDGNTSCYGPIVVANSVALLNHLRVLGNSASCSRALAPLAHLSANASVRFQNAVFHGNTMPSGALDGGISIRDSFLRLGYSSFSANDGPAGSVNVHAKSKGEKTTIEFSCSNFYGTSEEDSGTNDLFDLMDGEDDPRGSYGNTGKAPGFQNVTSLQGMGWDVHLTHDSDLVDPDCDPDSDKASLLDPDKSAADIGAYGGDVADQWDLDADGDMEWWQPRPYTLVDRKESRDCNDLDRAVNSAAGCPEKERSED
jgi:hypothetical protein